MPEYPSSFVLRSANVMGDSGEFAGPIDVHVLDGRVSAVGANLRPDAISFDFSGLFLMPGMFDCHDHVSMSTLDLTEALTTPLTRWVLEAAHNMRRTLEAGVTFVRDLGGADAGMRDAIDSGYVVGPTLQIAVVLISQTGGHGDGFLRGPGLDMSPGYLSPEYPGKPPYIVDGADSMRHVVRSVLRAGAQWIKLATTGGLFSDYDHPLVADFTPDEIQVAVEEAARKGRSVAAHAYGGEGLDNAVRAGVRSIEHGGFLTEEQAAGMAKAGCWLVPTLAAMRDCVAWAESGSIDPVKGAKMRSLGLDIGAAVRIGKQYGVRMATGTDCISRGQHGRNLQEIALMRQAGLSARDALLAATTAGAQLCGVDAQYGRISPGYMFDAIVVDDDPGDLSCFMSPSAVASVFKSGVPVVPHPRFRTDYQIPTNVADTQAGA